MTTASRAGTPVRPRTGSACATFGPSVGGERSEGRRAGRCLEAIAAVALGWQRRPAGARRRYHRAVDLERAGREVGADSPYEAGGGLVAGFGGSERVRAVGRGREYDWARTQ